MNVLRLALISAVLLAAAPALAEQSAGLDSKIRVIGREKTVVTKGLVTLGDIADIRSASIKDDEAVIGLQKITLADGLKPGEQRSFAAHAVLEQAKTAGVNLSQVGYRFPRMMSVQRASRTLTPAEVSAAIAAYFTRRGDDVHISDVRLNGSPEVSPGDIQLEAVPLALQRGSQQSFSVLISSADQPASRIEASALLERWGEVPVLRRAVPKGDVIGAGDVVMARMNLKSLSGTAPLDASTLIGLEAKKNLGSGEVLGRDKLAAPTIIKVGERVSVRFRSGLLEATAVGVALDDAGQGEPIRVRNEASKKVITGKAVEAGFVEVNR